MIKLQGKRNTAIIYTDKIDNATKTQITSLLRGIYTTTAEEGSLDECPMAYKDPRRILDFIEETVSDYELIKPIYNFKSC